MTFTCQICDNSQGNRSFQVREMQFGLRETFPYTECAACGCIQLEHIPENLAKYYPANYYSYRAPRPYNFLKATLKSQRTCYILGGKTALGWLGTKLYGTPEHLDWYRKGHLNFESEILDVGTGAGDLLFRMREDGFSHLTGMDPFIEKDVITENGVKILKRDLYQMAGEYDFIMLHHSFEHMAEPRTVLAQIGRLLKPDHYVLIRMPVAGSQNWRTYGTDWVALDAPRHFFIHTPQSMQILAEQTGFIITDTVFDSMDFGFIYSELYRRNIPLASGEKNTVFTRQELATFQRKAEALNRTGQGDTAAFYLYKVG